MHVLILSKQAIKFDDVALAARSVRLSRLEGTLASALDEVVVAAPDIALIHDDGTSSSLLAPLAQLQNLLPNCIVVPVRADPPPDLLLQLLHMGIPDVLTEISTPVVLDLVKRFEQRQTRSSGGAHQLARIIALMSGKGGAGATMIASNLAVALARAAPAQRVLLIDAALPFGDADIYLNAPKVGHHLGDFHESIERLDAALFSAMVQKNEANLDFIASPPSFQDIIELEADRISMLIRKARLYYDFIIIDISSRINPFSVAILENVDQCNLVVTPDILGARHAVQVVRLFEDLEFPSDKVSLCLNREVARNLLTAKDFSNTTGAAIARTIPDETPIVAKSLSQGKPIIDVAPHAAISRALQDWASELCGMSHKRKTIWERLKGN